MAEPTIVRQPRRASTASVSQPATPHAAPHTSGSEYAQQSAAAKLREQVQKSARPCGCKSGATLSAVALVSWPMWMWLSTSVATPRDILTATAAYPVVIITAGVAGKVAGIVIGRQRHRRLRLRLAALEAAKG
jgi:hypothetical protein